MSEDEAQIERVVRALTTTLRHHGVEMHPDDIRGLAQDAIAAMRSDPIPVYRHPDATDEVLGKK